MFIATLGVKSFCSLDMAANEGILYKQSTYPG